MRTIGKDGAGVALPKDRASLLVLATETERLVAQTAIALDRKTAQTHANELFRLGEIRARLGEPQKAERIYDEAATAFWKLQWPSNGGSPLDREWAALARIRQSSLAAGEGRYDEALVIYERLVEQFGGFPKIEQLVIGRAFARRAKAARALGHNDEAVEMYE
jgi:tetratricopeptide (TPR) repeat protein